MKDIKNIIQNAIDLQVEQLYMDEQITDEQAQNTRVIILGLDDIENEIDTRDELIWELVQLENSYSDYDIDFRNVDQTAMFTQIADEVTIMLDDINEQQEQDKKDTINNILKNADYETKFDILTDLLNEKDLAKLQEIEKEQGQ